MNKKNKKVYGVGINDYAGTVSILYNQYGEKRIKRYYNTWRKMLERCYSTALHKRRPSYTGCQIYKPWLVFSNFLKWCLDWELKHGSTDNQQLDKDFLGNGKLYSPNTCCFLPNFWNSLFLSSSVVRGQYPQGVCWDKKDKRFVAQINLNCKRKHLGYFNTPKEACQIYLVVKYHHIERMILKYPEFSYAHEGARRQMKELIHSECERYNLDESQVYTSI